MIPRFLPVPLLALAAPLLLSAQAPQLDGTQWAQLTIHERLIIRIPRVSPRANASSFTARSLPPMQWQEKKAPKCVALTSLTGAAVDREGEVDLVVDGTRRLRAKLGDDCPTLDFYTGFYLKPTPDGQLCAKRDSIRSRSGARCAIDKFRTLVAVRPKK